MLNGNSRCFRVHGLTPEDDVQSYTSDACNIIYHENDTFDLEVNWNKVGTCKHTRWSFQNESRFMLRIIPTEQEITLLDAEQSTKWLIHALSNGLQSTLKEYYLPLKDDIFDQMVVTLSPSIKAGQRVIVEALLNQYAPKAKIKESRLTQLVQMK